MVPVAEAAAPSSALDEGFEIVSVNVSSDSSSESCVVGMLTVVSVCPAVIVAVLPLAAVKSLADAVSPEPIDVLYSTVTSASVAALMLTAKLTSEPSTAVPPVTPTTGLPSSSRIVPVAEVSVPRSALDDGLDSVTVKVSSFSSALSPVVSMLIAATVSPAGIVSVPDDTAV